MADTNRNYDSASDISNGRMTIWIAGLKVSKDSILFGVGYENILENANEQLPIEFVERSPGLAANMHNIYVQILVGTGLPALISFLAFWGRPYLMLSNIATNRRVLQRTRLFLF